MANTVIAPIIKSSNDAINPRIPINYYYDGTGISTAWLDAPAVSSMLYCTGPNNRIRRMALAWDSSVVPQNKVITNISLYLYTTHGHSKNINYRYTNFNEGSAIPSHEPADGVITGGAGAGWKTLNLGVPTGNSVIISAELNMETIYLPAPVNGYFDVVQYWGVYSHRSSINQPYVVITYDDIPPEAPKSLYPSDIMLSTRNIIRFAWLHDSKEGLIQKSFTLQYSLNGGSTWTTINQNTPNQYYDMAANTLPTSGSVTWRVKTKDTNDAESIYSNASFTLGIPPQKAPIPVAPISQYVEQNKTVRFEWVFVGGSAGEVQSKYDLQYSANNGASWTTITEESESNTREIEGNSFSTGNVIWRVRTYNKWNEVSPYSENKSFTVIGSPSIPLITTITNTAKPIVSWQSTEQHIYELQILSDESLLYDSGKIPSTSISSYKIPIYLDDGQYRVRLRIANEYNLFSEWAEKIFIISTSKPIKPDIEVFSEMYGVIITSTTEYEAYVYRDNKQIGKMVNGKFSDYTCENKKEHRYFVRAIINDTFNDSDITIGMCCFSGNTLALVDNTYDFIILQYSLNKEVTQSGRFEVVAGLQYYDGRKYPVAEYSDFNSYNKTLQFFVETLEDVELIEDMIDKRKTFLLRGERNIYGAIFALEHESNMFGYDIRFNIEKIDYVGDSYD